MATAPQPIGVTFLVADEHSASRVDLCALYTDTWL